MKSFYILVFAAFCIVIFGCTSDYSAFYQSAADTTPDQIANNRAGPPPETPEVGHAQPSDNIALLDSYAKKGYEIIGYSVFNSGEDEYDYSAVEKGKEIGADLVVILNPKYSGSVTTISKHTQPTTSTSYSFGSTGYGQGRNLIDYGPRTTTTYGTTTVYTPHTIDRFDYGAFYFVKLRYPLGALVRDLNDDERQETQSNKGAVVRLIVDDSPAFNADMLVGDIIISMDGHNVTNAKALIAEISEKAGKTVSLSIIRQGKIIQKSLQLNE